MHECHFSGFCLGAVTGESHGNDEHGLNGNEHILEHTGALNAARIKQI